VTAFGKLIRTTAFRLTLAYLFLFALFAASLLGYFAWNTRRLITEQITATVNAETGEISDIFGRRGLYGLVHTIENRALRPGANLYLVTTPAGQAIAGNVGSLAPGVMATIGWSETAYRRLDEQDSADHHALVHVTELPSGFRLLIGRDLEERRRLFGIVAQAAQWSILIVVVLGLGGGVFVARRVLRRIDAITGTTQRIMAGDLSGRLPVGRSGDELDRLAENLNAMLERIEALMIGLKEVSDNIAHDLKTPLTRLRNRAEEALAKSGSETEYRSALERTIEESDGLIRTFNARVMIARAESGQARGACAASRQPRIDQPGAGQPGRECDQIRQTGLARATAARGRYRRQPRDRDRGAARRRCRAAQRQRSWPGNSASRSQTRGGTIRAAGGKPHPARFRAWIEPGVGGGDAAWR
jgi:HAMP domain-containing protein